MSAVLKRSATLREIVVKTHTWMLHPNSRRRRIWDGITVCFVLYLCWMIPFQTAFGQQDAELGVASFHSILDMWFFLDILLNFRTGFIQYGELKMSPVEVFKHYACTWLLVDLVGTIPFGILVNSDDVSSKTLKFVKYAKIPKLLRLTRLLKYFRQYMSFYRVVASVFGIWLMFHVNTCVWIFAVDPCTPELGEASLCTGHDVRFRKFKKKNLQY